MTVINVLLLLCLQRSDNDRLQSNVEHDRKTFDERLKRELGALKEQLQVRCVCIVMITLASDDSVLLLVELCVCIRRTVGMFFNC